MYRVKWREENEGWRVTVTRQIGCVEYRESGLVVGKMPKVEIASQEEQRCLNVVKQNIIIDGGMA